MRSGVASACTAMTARTLAWVWSRIAGSGAVQAVLAMRVTVLVTARAFAARRRIMSLNFSTNMKGQFTLDSPPPESVREAKMRRTKTDEAKETTVTAMG